jgi:ABC-type transporter Mla MlaB component
VTSSEPTVRFSIRGPIEPSDLPGLCRRVCSLLERTGAQIVPCDVAGVEVDAVCVDALARLSLAARRRGCVIRLEGVSPELASLVAFMGLEQVLVGKSGTQAYDST